MIDSPKHFKRERKSDIEKQSDSPQCPMYCPYGQPVEKKSIGSRVFLWIMIIICAAFALGFGGWGIFLTISGRDNTSIQETTDYNQSTEVTDTEEETNPEGSNTDKSYKGITIEDTSSQNRSPAAISRQLEKSVFQLSLCKSDTEYAPSSAIVLTSDGYLLTTAHAVNYSRISELIVTDSSDKTYRASVVGYDKATDIAVIKIDAEGLTPAEFADAKDLSVGDTVYNVSASSDESYSSILTKGIVNSTSRQVDYDSVSGSGYIQSDALVGRSGSGSALVNKSGQVVAMSISSAYIDYKNPGESYSVPVTQIRGYVKSIIQNGSITDRLRLGIKGYTVNKSMQNTYTTPQGVMIYEVDSEGSFKDTDAKYGDIITAIGEDKVATLSDVRNVLKKYTEGDKVKVKIYRPELEKKTGEYIDMTITLVADDGILQK